MANRPPPRITNNAATVKLGPKLATEIMLELRDNRPDSKLAARFKKIAENQRLAAARVAARYYVGMYQSVGDILHDSKIRAVHGRKAKPVTFRRSIEVRLPKRLNTEAAFEASTFDQARTITEALRGRVDVPASERVPLEPGTDTVKAWKPLSPAYAESSPGTEWERLPKSRVFWQKTGELDKTYQAWLASNIGRLSNPLNYYASRVVTVKTQLGPSRAGFVYPDSDIKFDRTGKTRPSVLVKRSETLYNVKTGTVLSKWVFFLQHPKAMMGNPQLERVFSRAFIEKKPYAVEEPAVMRVVRGTYRRYDAKTGKWKRGSYERVSANVRGFNRLLLAESPRPMLSRFAAAVGRREQAALRKLLKPR